MKHITNEQQEWINSTWSKIDSKLSKVAIRSRNKLPYTADANGVHDNRADNMNWWWTNGFWGGMMWLMYTETHNDDYRITAEKSCEMVNEIFKDFNHIDHDAGFLWHLTSGAQHQITGSHKAYSANMLAAASLASRYNIDGKFIRAWNDGNWNGIDMTGLTIIDTMMNLALLYWASEQIGDKRFAKIAMSHADMTLRDHVRPDGSVNHQVLHDIETGEFLQAFAGQGYSDTSCWSRGLAWAVYGSVISYIHTKEKRYLDAAVKTANYFIANSAPYDYLPPADFRAPKESFVYDSTAGACTACALLELSKYVSDAESAMYTDSAIRLLKAIDEKCACYDENIDYLVNLGTERCPRADIENPNAEMPIIYGDFFYVEAFLKLRGNTFFIW